MAKRIVKLFGEKTLDVIEHEAERLAEVPGIGKQRVGMIQRAWEEQKDIRDVMLFLQSQGVSSGYATKIYKAYGKDSIGIVKENPYRLAYDIYGIGFLTADKIAEKLDFEKDSPLRAEAGLLYALHELSDEGHVYYPTENLFEVASGLLKIEADLVLRSARDRLNEEKRIVTELIRIDGGHMSVTYLAGYHLAEVQAASRLRILSRALSSLRPVKVDAAIGWAEEKSGLKLAKRQKEAVASALTGGVGYGAVF